MNPITQETRQKLFDLMKVPCQNKETWENAVKALFPDKVTLADLTTLLKQKDEEKRSLASFFFENYQMECCQETQLKFLGSSTPDCGDTGEMNEADKWIDLLLEKDILGKVTKLSWRQYCIIYRFQPPKKYHHSNNDNGKPITCNIISDENTKLCKTFLENIQREIESGIFEKNEVSEEDDINNGTEHLYG
jgi:hypothetical protein